MLLSTYARWLDGDHNAMEMDRLEASLRRDSSPDSSQALDVDPQAIDFAAVSWNGGVGWLMGLEPTTTGITIRDSTN